MRGLLSFLLTMFIGLPSFAFAQNDSLGFDVIDYHAFQELPRESQREYLLLIMDTVVEMEEALIDKSGETEKRRVEILRKLLNELMLNSAYATTSSKSCLYAGWFSTYVNTSPTTGYCNRPQNSGDVNVKRNYQPISAKCGSTQQACNPDIFGTNQEGKPYCININKVKDVNASLSCLIAFDDDADKLGRLDRIIDRLGKDPAAADRFNKVVQTIFNTCVCQDNAKDNGHNVQIAQEYFNYMKGHRTCYSLVAQTQHIAERLRTNKPNACLVINSNNVDILAKDLKVLSHYTLRLRNVANLNQLSTEAIMIRGQSADPRKTIKVSDGNGGFILKSGATAVDYDKDNAIDNCLTKMRDPSSTTTCTLPTGGSLSDKKHCPFELPPVVNQTCKVKITPGVVADGKLNFEANLEIAPNGAQLENIDVQWKLGEEAPKTSKGGKFSGSVAVTGTKGKIPLSAKLTIAGKELPCAAPVEDFQGIVDDKIKTCEIGEAKAEIKDGKLVITTTAKALPPGAKAPAPKWKVGEETKDTLEFSPPKDDVNEVELTALYAVEEIGKPAIECKKMVPITRAETRQCVVADAKLAPVNGKPKARKISATIKMAQASMALKEGEVFKYQIAPDLTNHEGATVNQEKEFEAEKPEVKIIGLVVKGQGTVVTCEGVAKDVTPQTPGSCTLTPIMALNDKGEDIIEVSLTSSGAGNEPKGDVVFTGFAFKNSKPKVASVVIKKRPTAQKKKINATYKNEAGREFKCEVGVEIPAAEAQAAPVGPMPAPQQLPPSMPVPDIFLQGVN